METIRADDVTYPTILLMKTNVLSHNYLASPSHRHCIPFALAAECRRNQLSICGNKQTNRVLYPFRCQIYGVMMKKVCAIIIRAISDNLLQYLPSFTRKKITYVIATIAAVPLLKYHCSHCIEEWLRVFICRRHPIV